VAVVEERREPQFEVELAAFQLAEVPEEVDDAATFLTHFSALSRPLAGHRKRKREKPDTATEAPSEIVERRADQGRSRVCPAGADGAKPFARRPSSM